MRIAILADQHGSLPPIPQCDLMILSGDITGGNPHGPRDNSEERWKEWLCRDFIEWCRSAPHTIMVAGNHDTAIEKYGMFECYGLSYLKDSGCEYRGLKLWGMPWIRKFDTLAFNLDDAEKEKRCDLVPKGIDVLVCHHPPLGAGDVLPGHGRDNNEAYHTGCKWLAHTIQRVHPKLVACGHIHEGRGIYNLYGTTVINSALGFTLFDL